MRWILVFFAAGMCFAQNQQRWYATTGDVSQSGSASTSTIQQTATNASQTIVEAGTVYCSVACSVTFAVNGTAATSTTGTVTPLLPTPLQAPAPFTFWTASNVGSGTAQGGKNYLAAGVPQTYCFSTSLVCPGGSINFTLGSGQGSASNLSATVSSITGTSNVTYFVRTQ